MDIADRLLNIHHINSEKTSEIYQIISKHSNVMILWYMNGEIESRWYDTQNHLVYSDRKQFYNVTSVAAKKFDNRAFLAVCMHLSSIDRPNIIDGIITIYR